MSDASPYTFHRVGTENEPTHYELRDVNGHVVSKAFYNAHGGKVAVLTSHKLHVTSFRAEDQVETMMRAVVP